MIEKTNVPIIRKAVKVIYDISEDTRTREIARLREKAMHGEASDIKNSEARGEAKGAKKKEEAIIKKLKLPFSVIVCVLMLSSCSEAKVEEEPYTSETLVIARSETSHDHIDAVIDALKSDTNYSIEEKSFSSTDLLTMALLSGEHIDVIYSDNSIDVSPLAGKGMLADLSLYLDEEEYVRSVINAMKINGKLYEIPYDFDVETAAAKAKLWNSDTDTSFEHILEKSASLGCKIPFDYTIDSYGFTAFITSEYMDLENRTCRFESEDFKELIEFMKEYYRSVAELSNEQIYEEFKDDSLLIIATGFSGFDQLDYLQHDVGEKIEFIGFPSEKENFHIAVPRSAFSIIEASENKASAAEFIKKCTSFDSYVTTLPDGSKIISHGYSLPINSEALEFCYNRALTEKYYDIPDNIRKNNVDEIMHQINTISAAARSSDSAVREIINDELSVYFVSNKDSETVCRNIQNRCMIFFEEQYL